jgi:hypothetical protein
MIHSYTSYDINGYTFYTRAQDNKKTNQNSGVWTDAYDYDGNRETYYGFIEDIWELEYIENLKVPLFYCQWIRLSNRVKTNKYGMTNVNFRFLGYREHPIVLAKDVTQVFYVRKNKICWSWRCCWWGRVQPVWHSTSIQLRYHYPNNWWHRGTYIHTSWSRQSYHC